MTSLTFATSPAATVTPPGVFAMRNAAPVSASRETGSVVAPTPLVAEVPSTQESAARAEKQQEPSAEELTRFTEELQRHVNTMAPELQLSVDRDTGRSVITFTDRMTKEIIQQIPSKEVMQITKEIDQFRRGLLLNRKV